MIGIMLVQIPMLHLMLGLRILMEYLLIISQPGLLRYILVDHSLTQLTNVFLLHALFDPNLTMTIAIKHFCWFNFFLAAAAATIDVPLSLISIFILQYTIVIVPTGHDIDYSSAIYGKRSSPVAAA